MVKTKAKKKRVSISDLYRVRDRVSSELKIEETLQLSSAFMEMPADVQFNSLLSQIHEYYSHRSPNVATDH